MDVASLMQQVQDNLAEIHLTFQNLSTESHSRRIEEVELKRDSALQTLQTNFNQDAKEFASRHESKLRQIAEQRKREDEEREERRRKEDGEIERGAQEENEKRRAKLEGEVADLEEHADKRLDDIETEAREAVEQTTARLKVLQDKRKELNRLIDEQLQQSPPSLPLRRRARENKTANGLGIATGMPTLPVDTNRAPIGNVQKPADGVSNDEFDKKAWWESQSIKEVLVEDHGITSTTRDEVLHNGVPVQEDVHQKDQPTASPAATPITSISPFTLTHSGRHDKGIGDYFKEVETRSAEVARGPESYDNTSATDRSDQKGGQEELHESELPKTHEMMDHNLVDHTPEDIHELQQAVRGTPVSADIEKSDDNSKIVLNKELEDPSSHILVEKINDSVANDASLGTRSNNKSLPSPDVVEHELSEEITSYTEPAEALGTISSNQIPLRLSPKIRQLSFDWPANEQTVHSVNQEREGIPTHDHEDGYYTNAPSGALPQDNEFIPSEKEIGEHRAGGSEEKECVEPEEPQGVISEETEQNFSQPLSPLVDDHSQVKIDGQPSNVFRTTEESRVISEHTKAVQAASPAGQSPVREEDSFSVIIPENKENHVSNATSEPLRKGSPVLSAHKGLLITSNELARTDLSDEEPSSQERKSTDYSEAIIPAPDHASRTPLPVENDTVHGQEDLFEDDTASSSFENDKSSLFNSDSQRSHSYSEELLSPNPDVSHSGMSLYDEMVLNGDNKSDILSTGSGESDFNDQEHHIPSSPMLYEHEIANVGILENKAYPAEDEVVAPETLKQQISAGILSGQSEDVTKSLQSPGIPIRGLAASRHAPGNRPQTPTEDKPLTNPDRTTGSPFTPRDITHLSWDERTALTPQSTQSESTLSSSSPWDISSARGEHHPFLTPSAKVRVRNNSDLTDHTYEGDSEAPRFGETAAWAEGKDVSPQYHPDDSSSRPQSLLAGSPMFQKIRNMFEAPGGNSGDSGVAATTYPGTMRRGSGIFGGAARERSSSLRRSLALSDDTAILDPNENDAIDEHSALLAAAK
ncbi:hypothetical protein F5Y16DRAFT_420477 [Xylariaceae sp. FL0255]|nr:hypothetical protein F5Y16DRAFT_420477 [Xylariaceae sp. FL0255]